MSIINQNASFKPYPEELKQIMNIEAANQSRRWLATWSELRDSSTPLYLLPDIAKRLGIGEIMLKDESVRSPLGSFKALGAPIALVRLIMRLWSKTAANPQALVAGEYAHLVKNFTVISATDGNHGRALAAAAQTIGCACVIVLHANVSEEREQAIAVYGSTIVRVTGNYDAAVAEAARLAQINGWEVVSDTSYVGYQDIPRDVMQGYSTIAAEVIAQTESSAIRSCPFTHILLQGGVGGFAAGLVSYFWESYGADRPKFIMVEPVQADCLLQSALHGYAASATGSIDSVMAGLACGEASPLAWRFLESSIDAFVTISDNEAILAMQMLAAGSERDVPVVSGESGAAALAGLFSVHSSSSLWAALELNETSRVLLVNTEGATAPKAYQDLVGEAAESVATRQRDWLEQAAIRIE